MDLVQSKIIVEVSCMISFLLVWILRCQIWNYNTIKNLYDSKEFTQAEELKKLSEAWREKPKAKKELSWKKDRKEEVCNALRQKWKMRRMQSKRPRNMAKYKG